MRARKMYLMQRYNLTVEEYESMLASNGGCAICSTNKKVTGQEFMHVDHTERNGVKRARGVLCQSCNTGLGSFKHVPELLIKAARYLLADEENYSV